VSVRPSVRPSVPHCYFKMELNTDTWWIKIGPFRDKIQNKFLTQFRKVTQRCLKFYVGYINYLVPPIWSIAEKNN
jgi:hypothetical protein